MKTVRAMLRSTLCLLLCAMLLAGATSCKEKEESSQEPSNASGDSKPSSGDSVPDYLNFDGELPLVKEGENLTLKIAVKAKADSGDPEDVWMWAFVKEKMNINVEIEQTLEPDDYRALAFNSDNLPDVFLDMDITPVEMVSYGMEEKILISLTPYINETIMPSLSGIYEENPEWKERITCPDGNIYSLGLISSPSDVGAMPRLFLNGTWLQEAGMEIPTTLEAFTEMLQTFQSRGADITPIGGGYESVNPCVLLLSAFGYVTNDPQGLSPALRNGKVVIPYGDKEVYGEYLRLMKDYYDKGYISQDFYTVDTTSVSGEIAAGKVGVIADPPHLHLKETFTEWPAVKPLTSEYSQTPVWYASQGTITTGGFAVTDKCKYPELACRFADFFYCHMYYAQYGPMAGSDDTLGMVCGWKIDPSASGYAVYDDFTNDPKYAGLTSNYTYRLAELNGWPSSSLGYEIGKYPEMFALQGLEYEEKFDLTTGEGWYRAGVTDHLLPYAVMGYPQIAFYSQDAASKIADLKTVLDGYAETQSAQFITGARSLDELDDYFRTLESMEFSQYLSYYEDYYESIN